MVNSAKKTAKKSEKVVKSTVEVNEIDNNKADINNSLITQSQQDKTRNMTSPRSKGSRGKRSTNTPVRSSPRIVRRSSSYPNSVNRHFVNGIPILEITLRFDEDEYDVWRRQDTDEVNLHYLLRIKYPRDEDEQAWHDELERLKREVSDIRIIEEGWFEGVWVPLEKAKDIAHRYNIYEHVAALLDSENSWFDTPKKQSAKVKNERAMNQMNSTLNSFPEVPVETTYGTSTTTSSTRSVNYGISNGTVKSDSENKSNRRRTSERIKAKSQSSQEPSSSTTSTRRLREVESERDNFKEEVQNLKRKLDETEEYLNYGGNSKRRAIWAGIGAAVGAGITVVALSNYGIGFSDIAAGIYELPARIGGMFG